MSEPILATSAWKSNAELIVACRDLGYLADDWKTLDPTYGYGTFWKLWRPADLVGTDINPDKSELPGGYDFTQLHWPEGTFDAVVFDPPYKLNGTPTEEVDERYGVHLTTDWRTRMFRIEQGIDQCARVLVAGGYLLLKCQDQVCSGKVRWQTLDFTMRAQRSGLELVDRLDMLSYRPQPEGRRQLHARRNTSTLLVFRKMK